MNRTEWLLSHAFAHFDRQRPPSNASKREEKNETSAATSKDLLLRSTTHPFSRKTARTNASPLGVLALSLSSLFLLSRTRGISHSLPRIWPRSAKSCAYYSSSSLFLSLSLSLSLAAPCCSSAENLFGSLALARARTTPDEFCEGEASGQGGRGQRGPDDSPRQQPRSTARERERACATVYTCCREREKSQRDSIPPFCIPRALFFCGEQGRLLTPRREGERERSARELSCLLPTLYWSRISRYGTIKGCASGCLQGRYPRSGPLRSLDTKQSATKGKRERGKNRTGEW